MLVSSKFNNDFYQLANFFQPQINPLYCGIASSVIVLNAINGQDAKSQRAAEVVFNDRILPFHSYLQSSFLDENTDKIKKKAVIELRQRNLAGKYDPGLSLGDLARILREVHGLKVELKYADGKKGDLARFRADLKRYLADDEHFILANFDGKMLGRKTGGHISPLAAFNEGADAVLVMDVGLHKGGWFFAPVEGFFKAMNSKDGDRVRGWLVVGG